MFRSYRPRLVRLAAMAALIAAFGVSGCGVKGGLDPPPGAAQTKGKKKQAASTVQQPRGKRTPFVGQPQRKDFFLDWLLN